MKTLFSILFSIIFGGVIWYITDNFWYVTVIYIYGAAMNLVGFGEGWERGYNIRSLL